jgi:phytanoyl-CoA hydroxylase
MHTISLNANDIDRFMDDGFIILERILSETQCNAALKAMDHVYSGIYDCDRRPSALKSPLSPFGTPSSVRWLLNARTVDKTVRSIATDRTLGQSAATLLRTSGVSIIEDQLLDKPDGAAPVNMHQDYSYWAFSTSPEMISCWIALCDVSVDMGPVELIPGSHRWGMALRPRELIQGSDADYLSAIKAVRDSGTDFHFTPVLVPKGGGVFFHGLTFHGSRANVSGRCRRAMSLHWASSDCRLNRTRLVNYDHVYLFSGLKHGDPLVNSYLERVY